jgi:hypothetical protein
MAAEARRADQEAPLTTGQLALQEQQWTHAAGSIDTATEAKIVNQFCIEKVRPDF